MVFQLHRLKGYCVSDSSSSLSCVLVLCRRMNYTEAIVYLKEHNITKEDGTFYEFGEV